MKRTAAFSLAFLWLGAFAFAQQAESGGAFHAWNRGVYFPYFQAGAGPASQGWGPEWDIPPGVDQEWQFAYDGNGYGFSATTEFGGSDFFNAAGQAGGAAWFDTYFKLSPELTIELGDPRDYDFSVTSLIEANGTNYDNLLDCDEAYLALLEVTPMPGLRIAGGLFSGAVQTSGQVNSVMGVSPDFADNFALAASYDVLPGVTFSGFLKNEEQVLGSGEPGNVRRVFTADSRITAIRGVVVVASYSADYSVEGDVASYAMLGCGLVGRRLTVDIEGALAADNGVASFAVQMKAEYAVRSHRGLGVQLGYDDGKGVNWFEWGTGDWAGFLIYPYVVSHFDNGTRIQVGVLYATGAGTGPVDPQAIILPNVNQKNPAVAIPIDYIWSF